MPLVHSNNWYRLVSFITLGICLTFLTYFDSFWAAIIIQLQRVYCCWLLTTSHHLNNNSYTKDQRPRLPHVVCWLYISSLFGYKAHWLELNLLRNALRLVIEIHVSSGVGSQVHKPLHYQEQLFQSTLISLFWIITVPLDEFIKRGDNHSFTSSKYGTDYDISCYICNIISSLLL